MGIYERNLLMKVLFDLDGTLIDSRLRLYRLFQELVPESSFLFENYWSLKRNKINHESILSSYFHYDADAINDFNLRWLKRIESDEMLLLDTVFEGVSAFLYELAKTHDVFLVTARQSYSGVIGQLERFDWADCFKIVLVTEAKKSKFDLVSSTINTSSDDWFIGDTGHDVLTGKRLGMKTGAVYSGFLSKEKLKEYDPLVLADSVINITYS